MRILVVDNSPLMCEFMRELLEGEGHQTQTAESGLEALRLVDQQIPDVIFIDLVMPQIDGRQLSKLLRADPRLSDTYLVILSGIAAESRAESISVSADAHIAKSPFKTMRSHILGVLDDLQRGDTSSHGSAVLGGEQLYQREITNELLYSKHHLESLLAHMDDGFVELSSGGEVIYTNPAACSLLGQTEDGLITSYFPRIFPQDDARRIETALEHIGEHPVILGEEYPFEITGRKLLLRFLPVHYEGISSISVILQDITERKRAEMILRESLDQKENLLKEIHHRVKNNLSIVASLLSLQSDHAGNEEVSLQLIDSRNRVESIALVHEGLYNSEDQAGIDLGDYTEGIVRRLLEVYLHSGDRIEYEVRIPNLWVPMELAVPLAVIINEVVTNSLKHAFTVPGRRRRGRIILELREEPSRYLLEIADDGAGMPEGLDLDGQESETLGLLLVQTLVTQIKAALSLPHAEQGTRVVIDIPKHAWEHLIRRD